MNPLIVEEDIVVTVIIVAVKAYKTTVIVPSSAIWCSRTSQ